MLCGGVRRKLFASGPGEQSWWDKVSGAKDAGFDVTHVVSQAAVKAEDHGVGCLCHGC